MSKTPPSFLAAEQARRDAMKEAAQQKEDAAYEILKAMEQDTGEIQKTSQTDVIPKPISKPPAIPSNDSIKSAHEQQKKSMLYAPNRIPLHINPAVKAKKAVSKIIDKDGQPTIRIILDGNVKVKESTVEAFMRDLAKIVKDCETLKISKTKTKEGLHDIALDYAKGSTPEDKKYSACSIDIIAKGSAEGFDLLAKNLGLTKQLGQHR